MSRYRLIPLTFLSIVASCSSADGDAFQGFDAGTDSFTPSDAVQDTAPIEAGGGEAAVEAAVEAAADASGLDADLNLPPGCDIDVYHQYACCVFQGVNEFRQQYGVGLIDYTWHSGVADMATWYSERMLTLGVFAHGVDGKKCGSRMTSFGIEWSSCGENLARNTYEQWKESCDRVILQWAGSTSGHREAMLDDEWTHAGVGVVEGDGWWWVTMNFLEP